jgi:hypothetical protein
MTKMPVLSKHRNRIPIKIPTRFLFFFVDIIKTIQKFSWKVQGTRIPEANLEKRGTHSAQHQDCVVPVARTVCHCRTKEMKRTPLKCAQLTVTKVQNQVSGEREGDLCHNGTEVIVYLVGV